MPSTRRARSGRAACRCGDPGPDRRSGASSRTRASAVAPWREVRTTRRAPDRGRRRSGCRCGSRPRPAATTVGARSAWRRSRTSMGARATRSARRRGAPGRGGAALRHRSCRSSRRVASTAGSPTFPLARNRTTPGILAESVAPAPDPGRCRRRVPPPRGAARRGHGPGRHADGGAVPHARRPARRQRACAAGPQQRPLDDRGRGDLAVRAAHPGDLRPGSRLDGGPRAGAMVNLLGTGRSRPARLEPAGLVQALADPAVHVHLYDKRQVFERRKMGHVTALGATVDEALEGARNAADDCAGPRPRRSTTERRANDELGHRRAAAGRGRGRQPVGLPRPRAGLRRAHGARGPIRAARGLRASHAGPPVPLRRRSRRTWHPRDRRRRRRGGAPARDARGQDAAAGHRRTDPDPAPGRDGFAVIDRPDAARDPRRDGRHRQRA